MLKILWLLIIWLLHCLVLQCRCQSSSLCKTESVNQWNDCGYILCASCTLYHMSTKTHLQQFKPGPTAHPFGVIFKSDGSSIDLSLILLSHPPHDFFILFCTGRRCSLRVCMYSAVNTSRHHSGVQPRPKLNLFQLWFMNYSHWDVPRNRAFKSLYLH